MSKKQNSFECTTICWAIAAVVGLITMIVLYMMADFSGLAAFIIGLIVAVLLGFGLKTFVCTDQSSAGGLATDETAAGQAKAETTSGSAPAAAASSAAVADAPAAAETAAPAAASAASASTTASAFSGIKPTQPLAGEAELAERKGSWKYEAEPAPKKAAAKKAAPAKKAAAAKTAPAKTAAAAEKAPAKKTAAAKKAAPAKKAAAKKAEPAKAKAAPAAAEDAGQAPALLTAPPAEGADNLKLISGVGPKLEQTLNEMGIYTFAQVSAWGASDIAWVDSRLRFKGRIERDDWMSQAKTLAAGGETEFSKRSKK